MTTAVQHRRGTTAEHSAFTGLEGELTIDTSKDTAVIHDGALAGGYPLAKENLANVNPSSLASIDGASTASDDQFVLFDTSASVMKKITRAELNNAITLEALDNVDINGGTIDGTAIGSATPSTGAFTDLAASGSLTLSGGTANGVPYLNGSKVLTSGSALTFDGQILTNGVGGSGTTNAVLRLNSSDASSYGAYLQLQRNGVSKWTIGTDSGINGGTSDDLTIYGTANQRFYANGSEQMRLTSTGLGIGTSSPAQKLHLSAASGAIYEQITSGSDQLYLGIAPGVGGTLQSNTALAFYTGSSYTRNMTIDSSGNLGLGVTPSAWGGGVTGFDVGNYFMKLSGAGAYGGAITNNAYYDGGWKYNQANNATMYQTLGGAHSWHTAPSGAAGAAISFTQAMTLDASGNLGVGTTSPATKLHLQDNAAVFIQMTDVGDGASRIGQNGTALTFGVDTGNGTTERARIDTSGNFIHQVNATAPTLSTNSTMSFELTSNTSLKIVVRGTDGTTRSVSLTLA